MSTDTKGFVSDIFGDEAGEDVRQPLEYDLVKSYPSINSSNSGQVHSEENVRWLTKQFTKKPFIIQYDDNNMVEFDYDNSPLYATTATGGIVNIDGYIINTADDITKLSFDNTKDTGIGTGSTEYSGKGYINHVILQQAITSFIYGSVDGSDDGFTSNDITDYMDPIHKNWSNTDWEDTRKSLIAAYVDKTGFSFTAVNSMLGGLVGIKYTGELAIYIKENVDVVADGIYVAQVDDSHITDPEPYIIVKYRVNYGFVHEKIKYNNPDESTITYNDIEYPNLTPILFAKDIFGFLYIFNSDLDVATNTYPGQLNTAVDFLRDDITPGNNDPNIPISYTTTNIYDASTLYVSYTDEIAAIIEYDNNHTMLTQIQQINSTTYGEYPKGRKSTADKVAYYKFMDDYLKEGKYLFKYHLTTEPPGDWGTGDYYEITETASTGIYEAQLVPSGTQWESNKYYSKEDTSSTFVDYYVKIPQDALTDVHTTNAQKDLSTFFGNTDYFDIITRDDIFSEFETYEERAITADDMMSDKLKKVCNSYYCLPLSRLHSDFKRLFCIPLPHEEGTTTPYIPVGFITSSGAIAADNVQYTETVNGNKVTRILVEGYGALIRNICKTVAGYDNQDTYKGEDISDISETSKGWRMLLKDLQTGNVTPATTPSTIPDEDKAIIVSIFGVSSMSEITFDKIYNTVLAPYINFYVQLAWSTILDKTLINGQTSETYPDIKGKFKSREAYTIVKDLATSIISDNGTELTIGVKKVIPYNGQNFTVTKYANYLYNQYTDYDKLCHSLCTADVRHIGDNSHNIAFRHTADIYVGNDSKLNIRNIEDYITYIVKGTQRSWDYNLDRYIDNVNMTIPYKVTTLERDSSSTYGFATFDKMVDSYVRYTNKYTENNTNSSWDYLAANSENDPDNIVCTPEIGYVQNVVIRTDNFLPRRVVDGGFVFPPKYGTDPQSLENIHVMGTIVIDGVPCTRCPLQSQTFPLHLIMHYTIDYSGQGILSGFAATGNAQGWCVCVPTLFRLYKDGQNYLNGRKRGTADHGGVYIDYKLPNSINNKDFWFANTWLSSVRSAGEWDIESASCDYPSSTDGMIEYLTRRNHTLFNVNIIYDIDEYGNYISIDDIIQQYINVLDSNVDDKLTALHTTIDNEINVVDNKITQTPHNKYVEFIYADENNKVIVDSDYTGMRSNIDKLRDLFMNTFPIVKSVSENEPDLYFSNNTHYQVIRDAATNTNINIKTAPKSVIWEGCTTLNNQLQNQRYVLNTSATPNSNNAIHFTVHIESDVTTLTIKLYNIINEFHNTAGAFDNYLAIDWKSNEDMVKVSNSYCEITLTDAARVHCFLDITITPKLNTISSTPVAQELAVGWCIVNKQGNVTTSNS